MAFEFLEIDGMKEFAVKHKINTNVESDAWDLIEEAKISNTSLTILLTPRIRKDLNKIFRKKSNG